jgi:hypothetical protein
VLHAGLGDGNNVGRQQGGALAAAVETNISAGCMKPEQRAAFGL